MIAFPVIDTHVHLLDQKLFKYSWAKGAPKLARDWTLEDLASSAKPYMIESAVFVEVDVDHPDYLKEARWVQTLADRDPRMKGCVACLPIEKGAALEDEIAELSSLPVARGVRRLIQNQPDPEFVLRADVIDATKRLAKYNLSFDLCIFHHQLKNTIAYVKACPDVFFIMDHIAKPGIKAGLVEPWKTEIRELAALPNVVCKLSGVTTEADHDLWTPEQLKPYVEHVIDVFGFDRLMYGGDWPVSELAGPYTAWIGLLDQMTSSCSETELRKLFRDNAQKFYRLA